jgi:signal peptidase I
MHGRSEMAYIIRLNDEPRDRRKRSREYGCVHLIALGALMIVGALLIRNSPFRLGVVVGESMTPTLQPNEVFVLDRSFYEHTDPTRGEIVVADANGDTCVKRVAAGPGEEVWLVDFATDGDTGAYSEVIEARDLPRMRRLLSREPRIGRLRHVFVPDGQVFLVGDAQNISWDSRNYGPIPTNHLLGRVFPLSAKHDPGEGRV